MLHSLTNPETWQAARQDHASNPGSHPSRVYARRWRAAGAAAALAPIRSSHVRSAGYYAGLTCSDICTALLIQEVLAPGDAMRPGVLARMLGEDVIDLGHVRIALTQNPVATRNCIVDCTEITPDGPDFTTSLRLWSRDNDQAEIKLSQTSPAAYLNTRTGEVLLAAEVLPLHLTAYELHLLLRTPYSERSAFVAELENAREPDVSG